MTATIQIKRRILGGAAGAPASLGVGELAFSEVDGELYIGRSNASVIKVVTNYVAKAGDTMTGGLILNYTSPNFVLRKTAAGQTNIIYGHNGNTARWHIQIGDGAAESGSNVGSDLGIGRYNDAGSYIDQPFVITRSTGLCTVSGDPTSALGIATKQYVDAAATSGAWSTGDAKITFKASPDAGWVFMNDGTIGDASSGSTTRANADTANLFSLLWTNIVYTWQWNCTISIASPAVISGSNNFTVGQRVRFTTTGVLPSPLAVGTDYFVISAGFSAGSSFQISTSYGGAAINTSGTQSGSHIVVGYFELIIQDSTGATTGKGTTAAADFAAHKRLPLPKQLGRAIAAAGTGSGLTQRYLGNYVGEESHVQSAGELATHSHGHNAAVYSGSQIFSDSVDSWIVAVNPGSATINNAGSSTAANVMQPTSFWNVMIKL